jgi:hypothetical protein
MTLAPFDVFVGIAATWMSRFFCALNALGVHDGCCGLRSLAYPFPLGGAQDSEDDGAQSTQSESPEVVVNGRARREVVRQKSPLAASFEYVEDGVKNIAYGMSSWSFSGFWGRQVLS